ncbi:hypothetical protein ABT369_26410 [Dactylosporangium sp. NPDC000244]|uniref:hypothetical protein n=1 Tax=Dactylosporangium sp. NPDC000244 TaxID=3154365 RepID=UPI00331B0880
MGRSRRPIRLRMTGRCALVRAERLLEDGRAAEAAQLMVKTYLRGQDPQTAVADEDLIDAVGWYVQAVDADPAAIPEPLAWARWAYAAAHQLHADGPDLDTLQVGVGALTHALLRAGQPEEALIVRREAIQVAAARGDTVRARRLHGYLASELHAIGRCAEAADEGLVAVEPIFDLGLAAPADDIAAAVGVFMALESCHRHDDAAALVARLGRYPAGLAAVALVTLVADTGDLLHVLSPDFQAHTGQHHADTRCARLDCPIAHGGAVGARFYGALLAGHDPETAPADVGLIRVATRFVLFPGADQQEADAAAWASYAHRSTLATPGARVDEITAATRVALHVADRRGAAQAGIDACRAALAALAGRAGVGEVVAVRLELARRLHRAGFCAEALTEAAAALVAYEAISTGRDVTGVTQYLSVASMFDACHRHDDIHALGLTSPFDGAYFNDRTDVLAGWLVTFEESRQNMLEHLRTFHPDAACTHTKCATNLAAAADIPHQRALRHIVHLYDQHRIDDAIAAVRQHLAEHDPTTSPPSQGLARIALCHLTNAVEHLPDERDASVLPWGRYARHAADALDPDRGTGWTALISMFVRAATLYGAHAEAIDAAAEASNHGTDSGDIPAAISAQFEFAAALHAAGHCAEARDHATAAWHDALEHLDPADPEQRLAGLLAGTDLMHLLGDCHQHEQAVAVMARAAITYGAHDTTTEVDASTEDRERRWQRANRGFIHRSDRHRTAYHVTDPCLDQHEHIDAPVTLALQGIPAHTDVIPFLVAVVHAGTA